MTKSVVVSIIAFRQTLLALRFTFEFFTHGYLLTTAPTYESLILIFLLVTVCRRCSYHTIIILTVFIAEIAHVNHLLLLLLLPVNFVIVVVVFVIIIILVLVLVNRQHVFLAVCAAEFATCGLRRCPFLLELLALFQTAAIGG